ncbi:putative cupredoxin [Rosa chinensis]|uniref:Putative cupredoxin n=1 Tax=Rosa chinensis TaxID=74649 RepID=A0A2P6RIS1_ROSCH|nr:blue copper protein [Rosa chinensis]PRQ46342.1 putative cupredoxin [Rosa chinensis]
MGSELKYFAVLAITVAALLHSTAAIETHVVGDEFGWIVPPGGHYAYEAWASGHKFSVGDILEFNFTTGDQDVAMVTKEAFDSCNSTSPIELKTTGPANFTLDTIGSYYFIGTMDKHCELGQKLAINVTAHSGSPTPSPSPKPSPTPRGPVTYVVGDHFGWIVPPGGELAYSAWAYGKTFYVGDTLEFNFTTGDQDVAMVTKQAYESCNFNKSQITILTTGPAYIKLNLTGEYYFIGTMDKHCELGQKLAINVTTNPGGPSASPTPAPAPTPRGPVTYIVGDQLGWFVPGKYDYSAWANGKTFIVGDTLVFNFINGTQDVAVVTKAVFDNCTTNSTLAVFKNSPVNIIFNTTGEHYFTSTYDRHCELGQKLAINVTAKSTGTATSPSSSTTPSSHAPSAHSPAASAPYNSATPSNINGSGYFFTFLLIGLAFFH